jgi:NFU1 iron-sulfur cluster scaffold homolog, mitochondrial
MSLHNDMSIRNEVSEAQTLEKRVITVIDELVRPYIERDGGRITFHSIAETTVFVELSGACSTCSASSITLKAGVERVLRKEVREIKSVKLWNS